MERTWRKRWSETARNKTAWQKERNENSCKCFSVYRTLCWVKRRLQKTAKLQSIQCWFPFPPILFTVVLSSLLRNIQFLLKLTITTTTTFMQGMYNYVPETNHVSRVHSVAAVHIMLLFPQKVMYSYISTFRSKCAVTSMTVFCSSFISCFPGVLFRYYPNDEVPVASIITGITLFLHSIITMFKNETMQ